MIHFTTGCFDLFHLGHMKFLRDIESYIIENDPKGKLIIALNSDKSIQSYKNRTSINDESVRKAMIEEFVYDESFERVIIFDSENELSGIIKALRPDFYYKDENYFKLPDIITGYKFMESIGTKFIGLERHPYSTTDMIAKVKTLW